MEKKCKGKCETIKGFTCQCASMDYKGWVEYGKKYGYYDYFKGWIIGEILKKIENE